MQTFSLSRGTAAGQPDVAGFFDPRTFSVQYIVSDRQRAGVRLSTRCWIMMRSPAPPPRITQTNS